MLISNLTSTYYSQIKKIFAVALCYIMTLTFGCTHADDKNYFPLSDGAKWEYAGRASSEKSSPISFRVNVRVDGETLIGGQRYFKHLTSSDLQDVTRAGKDVGSVRYYRVGQDGIYFRLGSDLERPEVLEMPLPIPIDMKWLSGATEVQAERAGMVTVNGRQYSDCLKVTFKQSDGVRTTEQYLAPGVGAVKILSVNHTEPQSTIELTLEKYER